MMFDLDAAQQVRAEARAARAAASPSPAAAGSLPAAPQQPGPALRPRRARERQPRFAALLARMRQPTAAEQRQRRDDAEALAGLSRTAAAFEAAGRPLPGVLVAEVVALLQRGVPLPPDAPAALHAVAVRRPSASTGPSWGPPPALRLDRTGTRVFPVAKSYR